MKQQPRQFIIDTIDRITPPDRQAMEEAAQRQESLAKPPGSLGGLENIAIRMAGIAGRSAGLFPAAAGAVSEAAVSETEKAFTETGEVFPKAEAYTETAAATREERFPGKGCVIVFCADNGVAAQGVSSAPQSVTRAQTINFTRRITGVGALSRSFHSELLIVDMGVKDPIPRELYDTIPLRDTHKIIDRRIRPGTWDISEGPAMTEEEALQAMATGAEMAQAAAEKGFGILGIGEMGIGNTTTSSAVLSVITGATADQTCGRGGGLNDTGFRRKKEIIDAICEEFRKCTSEAGTDAAGATEPTEAPEPIEPTDAAGATAPTETIEAAETHLSEGTCASEAAEMRSRLKRILRIMSRCGGFDLAAMTGAFLGAAAAKVPVVIDGYISVVAAMAAAEIAPDAASCMFASHVSAEQGYSLAIQRLAEYSPGLAPFLALDMRLGEGSGCPISFEVIRGACDVMRTMATFEEAEINDDYLEEIRAGGCF